MTKYTALAVSATLLEILLKVLLYTHLEADFLSRLTGELGNIVDIDLESEYCRPGLSIVLDRMPCAKAGKI